MEVEQAYKLNMWGEGDAQEWERDYHLCIYSVRGGGGDICET